MARMGIFQFPFLGLLLGLASVTAASSLHAQGINLTGVGPVNRSMGGAGTAAPLDSMGALHWNPGSITALANSEIGFGVELLSADVRMSSGGATTSGDAGWCAIPSIGWVHHLDDSPLTVGLGVYAIGGFKNNMPADTTNPVFAVLGGPAFASAEIMQIAPTLSCQVTENVSVGIAPTITTATVIFDPLGPSVISPAPLPGQGNRMHWGGGFQAGVYYQGESGINAGFTFKSTQWIEELNFFTTPPPGGPGRVNFNLDYPMILSMGMSYTGLERWVFAIDGRYFDYERTAGFRELGWRSVLAGAIGAQFQVTERIAARAGYNFNQNPIQSGSVFANLFSPLIQTHNVTAGGTYRIAENVDLNLAYVYLVNSSVTGPSPFGPINNQIQAHSLIFGVGVRY